MNKKQLKEIAKSELAIVDSVVRINLSIMSFIIITSFLVGSGILATQWGHLALGVIFLIEYLILNNANVGLKPLAIFKMSQMAIIPKCYRKNLNYLNTLYQGMLTLPFFIVLVYFVFGPWIAIISASLGMWITFTAPKFADTTSFVKRSNKAYKKGKGKKKGFLSRKSSVPDMVDDLNLTFSTTITSEVFYSITVFITKQLIMVLNNIIYVINRAVKI